MYQEIKFTPTLDAGAYSADDVLFDMTEVANFVRQQGQCALIKSLCVLDFADQKIAMDIIIGEAAGSIGAANAAFAPSDAVALASSLRRLCNIATGDYLDAGGVSLVNKGGLDHVIRPVQGGTSIYMGAVTRGSTPTYGVSGLTFIFGLDYGSR